MQFDWSAIWPAIPLLIEGAKMTLWISVLGLAGGLVIGLLAGFARTFGGWIANHVALVFIEVIRGTPIVVQVMFIYFALPMAFNDLRIDPFTAAVVTIMIDRRWHGLRAVSVVADMISALQLRVSKARE